MRVLHVISGIDPQLGGPTVAVAGLMLSQQAAGLDVSLAATFLPGADSAVADRLSRAGIETHLIGPATPGLKRHRDIRPTLLRMLQQPDIVHIHALWEEIQHRAARLAHGRGLPYVITPHGMLTTWSLGRSRWRKRLYLALRLRRNLSRAAAIHFTTHMEREHSLKAGVPAIVEPLGLDLAEFGEQPPQGEFRQRFDIDRERLIVAFMGRIHPGKGLERLVPAFARSAPPHSKLIIIGPDSKGHRGSIEALTHAHGLGERVVFTGMLRGRERNAALTDADLFILPSDHENFGMAVIEALACGTPVIISDQVGVHHEIVNAGVGAAVPLAGDALQQELHRWLHDDKLHIAASHRARSFALTKFQWPSIARRWQEHYGSVRRHMQGGRHLNAKR